VARFSRCIKKILRKRERSVITAINKTLIPLLAGCVLAIAAPFASADVWNFGTACNMPTPNGHGAVWKCNGTAAVDVAAWSTTGPASTTGQTFDTATAALYTGGFGVKNQNEGDTSPNHSMDDASNTDLLSFSFNQSVELDKITTGWSENDADISVLAYQGTNAPASILGKSASELVGLGWTMVGDYGNASGTVAVNASNISSKYWLISSYNALYDSNTGPIDISNDYVKIFGVEGVRTPVKVPEPSPLALIAVAMLGLCAIRRRGGQQR
jgi:hypothetical protein